MIPLKYNLRSLAVRRTTTVLTAAGIGMVVIIVVLLLGVVAGLRSSMELAIEPHSWILMSSGIDSEAESYVSRDQYELLKTRNEISTGSSGMALISPEIVTPFNGAMLRRSTQFQAAYLRGVYPVAYQLHKNLKLVQGRWPVHGREEIAIGLKQAERLPELRLGSRFKYGRGWWTIVGVFSDHASAREGEFWTDLDTLQQDTRFESAYSSIHLSLKPGTEGSFLSATRTNAQFNVNLISERDFYRSQAVLADQLLSLIIVVALIVGIGAAFGGMNTMYSSVAHRSGELAVLRALGFGRIQILVSFLLESLFIAVGGGIVGTSLAMAVFYGTHLESRQLKIGTAVFSSRIDWPTIFAGLTSAVLIGIAGGLLPAWRAGRIEVLEALRKV